MSMAREGGLAIDSTWLIQTVKCLHHCDILVHVNNNLNGNSQGPEFSAVATECYYYVLGRICGSRLYKLLRSFTS